MAGELLLRKLNIAFNRRSNILDYAGTGMRWQYEVVRDRTFKEKFWGDGGII